MSPIFRNLFRKQRVERELDDEVRSFVAMKTEENIRAGMSPDEARRAALVESGGIEQVKEAVREVRAGALLEQLWQDLRFGLRMLRKNPGFTLVAVLTIALGIGVNAGIFALINAVGMQPLRVEDSQRVVSVYQVFHGKYGRNTHGESSMMSYAEYLDYRDHSDVFSGLMVFTPFVRGSFAVSGREVLGQLASCNYFDVLRAPMAMGRGFLASECSAEGSDAVVVLSDAAWRNEFAADPAIVGKTIRVNRQQLQVIGVTAPGFTGVDLLAATFWAPLTMQRAIEGGAESRLADSNLSWLVMMGRLKDGVTIDQARAQLAVIASRIDRQYPGRETRLRIGTASLLDTPEAQQVVLGVGTVLLLAVGMVLLIVCANVANLMLARATGRRREFAVRLAVGAAKGRILRQLLTESLLLSSLGGMLGLVIAIWASKVAVLLILRNLPAAAPALALQVHPDFRVFAYAFALALLTGIAFGLAPARQAIRLDVNHDLKRTSMDPDTDSGRKTLMRHMLLGAQVAFCALLLIAAGLLLRGMQHAQVRDPGFRMDHVAVVSMDLKAAGYTPERAVVFHRRLADTLAGMPGVQGVATTTITQISGGRRSEQFAIPNHGERNINNTQVSPGYFEQVEIPIVRGRNFTAAEASSAARVAIVTESTARALWPGEDPVGKHVVSLPSTDFEVVGVVKDTDTVHLGRSDEPFIYELAANEDYVGSQVLVRSAVDFAATAGTIRTAVRDVDPELPVQIAPLSDNLELFFAPSRIGVGFAALMGLLALAIAAIGIYGTVAYAVGRRTREIGIRIALGARRKEVVGLVVGNVMKPVLTGAFLGLAGSAVVSQLLTILLFGMNRFDPWAYGGVIAFLFSVALLASYIPARRALKIDPMTAIRND